MSYKVLARKWRPSRFDELIGQGHVVKALSNALDGGRVHHAYLFTGMRGVGKTTIARVFAKCLNCETNGVSASPCGTCTACTDIDAGRFLDLIEVDAASRTKVDETRELLENVPYAPAGGRYKVYLIDEVHMFSNHSFNALLKTLEEPPEHVKFILATTDPQKVPVTILSRCLQFNLKGIPRQELAAHLAQILESENIGFEPQALEHIALASEGSARDALSLVEQAAALGQGTVTSAGVEAMLGRVSPERVLDIIDALSAGDAATLLRQIDQLAEYSPDFSVLLADILSALHDLAILRATGSHDASGFNGERLNALLHKIDETDVQMFYQIALLGRRDIVHAPVPRDALDMTLLRMIAFRPAEQALASENSPGGNGSRADLPGAAVPPVSSPVQAAPAVPPPAVPPDQTGAKPAAQTAVSRPSPNAPGAMTDGAATGATSQPPATPVDPPSPTMGNGSRPPWSVDNWSSVVESLPLSGMPKQLASHCAFVSLDNGRLSLALESTHEHLNSPRFAESLQRVVQDQLGRDVQVVITVRSERLDSPARQTEQQQREALAAAQDSIRNDPMVQVLVDTVNGVVDESSIRPVAPEPDS